MNSRFGIVTQAIGVAALVAIVYLAFLHPRNPNPLAGIEVEGGLPVGAVPGENANRNGQRSASAPNGGRGSRAVGIRLIPTSPSGTPPTIAIAIDTDTPTGSQYQNAVGRVLGQLARTQPSVPARQDPAP